MKVHLHIPVNPKPWKAPKIGNHGAYSEHTKFKDKVRYCISQQYVGYPYAGYVCLLFGFYFPIPKKASKADRQKMLLREILPLKGDCTNCQKLFEDCLNKLVIEDDKRVVVVSSYKAYAEEGSVEIIVQDYEGYFREHENQLTG